MLRHWRPRSVWCGVMSSELSFGAWRGKWLDQVQDDPKMMPSAFSVMYAVTRHLNTKTRTAFPGNDTLAATARVSLRTVQKVIALAGSQGHLAITDASWHNARVLTPILKVKRRNRCTPNDAGVQPGVQAGVQALSKLANNDAGFEGQLSELSELSSVQVRTCTASFDERTMTTKGFKAGKETESDVVIMLSHEDEQALDVVREVLGNYGGIGDRLMIGGIIDCAARQKMGDITGNAIGRLVAAGRLRRDGQYVWLPDQDDATQPADPEQVKKVLATAASNLAWHRDRRIAMRERYGIIDCRLRARFIIA
jgi:hypothetical protein